MPERRAVLLLAAKPCSQCLTTRNRIVTGQRAAQIVRECRQQDNHFFCHRDPTNQTHCAGMNRINPGRAYRFAVAYGIPVERVDMDVEGEHT